MHCSSRLRSFAAILMMIASASLMRAQDGGGALPRDIMGGAALIFRKPQNPQVGGGKLGDRPRPRPPSQAQNQLIAKGNAARSAPKPRYSEAVKHYSKAATLDPTDPRAFAGIGNVYIDQGIWDKAVEQYRQAVNLRSDYVDALMPMGLALVQLKQYQEAIDVYVKARAIEPNNPEIHNNLGYIYNQKEAYSEAIQACEKAIALLGVTGQAFLQGFQTRNDVLAHAYKNLGNAYSGLKQYRKAAEALKQATVIEPKNAAAHFNLGLTLYNEGRYAEAIVAYKEVVNLRPTLAAGHFNLALAYLAVNDRAAAIAEYNTLKSLNPKIAEELHVLIKP